MRLPPALLLIAALSACQSAPPADAPAGSAGTTTRTEGTPTVVSSDTTRARDTAASSGAVQVTLDRTSYARGATITMRITSRHQDTLGFNQCSSRTVERQDGTRWVPYAEPDRMCTMELQLLMPGETQSATTDLPANVTAGAHRIVMTFNPQSAAGGAPVRAVSPTFRVN